LTDELIDKKGRFKKGHKSWNEGKGMSPEEKKIKRKISLDKYNNSEKGKATKKRNRKEFYINNPDYNKNYFKDTYVPVPIILKKKKSSKTKRTPDEVRANDRKRYHIKKNNDPLGTAKKSHEYYESVKNTDNYKMKRDDYMKRTVEIRKIKSKKFRDNNKDKLCQNKRDYYNRVKNDPIVIQKRVDYRKNNRPALTILGARYRAKKAGNGGNHSLKEWNELKKITGNHCLECWKVLDKLAQDHIIPITKGGTDFIDNIQPLCKSCNSSKHNKYNVPNLLKRY
jgi:5-methylcytosine-specific restriction endonuclease McrA